MWSKIYIYIYLYCTYIFLSIFHDKYTSIILLVFLDIHIFVYDLAGQKHYSSITVTMNLLKEQLDIFGCCFVVHERVYKI